MIDRRQRARWAVGILSLAALCPVTATAADQPGWKTYQNGRFGYSVGYPVDRLKPLPESDNGDGRGFKPLNGHMDVSVWAGYDSDTSLSGMAGEAERDCLGGKADYKVIRDKKTPPFMALSCMKAGQSVFYTKALRCKDVVTQIEFAYPKSEQAAWDSVVSRMASSLGAGCGID